MCFPESSEFQRAPVEPKGGWRYVRRAKARCIIWTQIRKIVTFSVFHKSKKIEHCNCLFEFWSQNKFHTLILKNVSSKRRGFNRACAGGGGLKTNTRVHQIWGGACLKIVFLFILLLSFYFAQQWGTLGPSALCLCVPYWIDYRWHQILFQEWEVAHKLLVVTDVRNFEMLPDWTNFFSHAQERKP